MNNDHPKGARGVEYDFREFSSRSRCASPQVEQSLPAPCFNEEQPLFRALDLLSSVFERETEALRLGDFIKFKRIQSEKQLAIRAVEKAEKSAPFTEAATRKAIEERLSHFNAIIDRNMKMLDAMRTAVASVKKYAMSAIEAQQRDGVYEKGGALRGPERLSAGAGNHIKL